MAMLALNALTPAGRALHGLDRPTQPGPLLAADLVQSLVRKDVQSLGRQVALGQIDANEALEDLLASDEVQDWLSLFPALHDAFDVLEVELAGQLADQAAIAQRAGAPLARRPQARGLPAYHSEITEPRREALARQDRGITGMIAKASRIGAARRELLRERDAQLPFLLSPSPAAKAAVTRRLNREIAAQHGFSGRIPLPPRLLVSGSQGTKKTFTALVSVAAIAGPLMVRYVAPTMAKAKEAHDDYVAMSGLGSLPAFLLLGRAQLDPDKDGARMCGRHAVAERVSKLGLSVRTTLCGICPLADGCGHLKQHARLASLEAGFIFGTSAGLFAASAAPAADLLIADERLVAEDVSEVPLRSLLPAALPYEGAAHPVMQAVHAALLSPDAIAALRAFGIDRRRLQETITLLEPLAAVPELDLSNALDDDDVADRLDAVQRSPAADVLTILRAVAREIDQPRKCLNGVSEWRGTVFVSRLKRPIGVTDAAVLLLDGTGDPELNRAVFGARLEHCLIRVERDARVTGTKGRTYSRQSITAKDARGWPIPNRDGSAARQRADLCTVASRLPNPYVAGPKAAIAMLDDNLPVDAETGHFGSNRGSNQYRECGSALICGRTSLHIRDLEAAARCYMADDPAPFFSADVSMPPGWRTGWPYVCTRMRRMRDSTLSPIEVEIHPDPRVQRVLEQIREAEIVQQADRTRPTVLDPMPAGVRQDADHRRIVLANSLALDFTYDEVLTHAELVAGSRALSRCEQAGVATGIVPRDPDALHRMHRKQFPTLSAAKNALRSGSEKGVLVQKDISLAAYTLFHTEEQANGAPCERCSSTPGGIQTHARP